MSEKEFQNIRKVKKEEYLHIGFVVLFHCNEKKCRYTNSYRHAGDGLPEDNVDISV